MRRPLAWILWVGALAQAVVIALAPWIAPEVLAGTTPSDAASLAVLLAAIAIVVTAFATAGLVIVARLPGHAVGWLMLVGGPMLGAVFVGYVLGYALTDGVAQWLVLAAVVLLGPALFVIGPSLAMLFPTGRFLSDRWRSVHTAVAAAIVLGALATAIVPGPLESGFPLDNPIGVEAVPRFVRDIANIVTALAVTAGGIIGIAALIVRYRRSEEVERHQLKWFMSAVGLWVAVLPLAFIEGENWLAIIAMLGLALVPMSVVVAIRRYRLYEIDTLINRALIYIPLVGVVAGLYAACVALLQRLFVAVTGDTSDSAGVISALVLAAVFTPIRNAIQGFVDKRFKPDGKPDADPAWDSPAFASAVEEVVERMLERRESRGVVRTGDAGAQGAPVGGGAVPTGGD